MKFVSYNKPTAFAYRFLTAWVFALLVCLPWAHAEGLRQVAPTAADSPVMLETGRPDFGRFAAYNGPENGRLYITIGDVNETVFLGLSPEYNDFGLPFAGTTSAQYSFRIRFEDGSDNPVVHGPFVINNNNANTNSWESALFGNYPVTTVQNGQLMFVFQPNQVGNYFIEFNESIFQDGDPKVNIPFWDITVADNNVPINGRVWSRGWAFRTPPVSPTLLPDCEWNRTFNGAIYSYTNDGFVSRINFEDAGMQGLSFNLTFNSRGPGQTGILTEDRKSIPGQNATFTSAQHQVFLSEPDPVLFPSGACGQLFTPASFTCSGENDYCLEVTVTKPGQVEVILDFNQNGVLDTDSEDVNLVYDFPEGQLTACIPWDGLRGNGTPIAVGDTIDLIFFYSQGIQHWAAYDVEYMRNGYCVETVRPLCEPNLSSNQLYWDDRNIPDDPGTGAVKDGRNGCDCRDNCRNWDNFNLNSPSCTNFDDEGTTGYGDKSTINTWWFANTATFVRVNIPLVQGSIAGPTEICPNETATYIADYEVATGTVSYTWTGPNGFSSTSQQITVSTPGEYCVLIADELGCSTTICRTLSVLDPDDGSLTYPVSLNACLGNTVTITPAGNVGGYTYSWTPGTGLSATDVPNPSFTFVGNITYTVNIFDPITGCTFQRTVDIVGNVEPLPTFTTSAGCEQGLTINFSNTSTSAVAYSWNFGDPTTTADISNLAEPSYTYPAFGNYTVTLTATSADGCVKVITQNINVVAVPLSANFDVNYNDCSPTAVEVQFTDTSVNGGNNTTGYTWAFSGGFGNSTLPNPTITVTSNQTITAILTIITAEGCVSTISRSVNVVLGPPEDQFPEDLTACPGIQTQIIPGGDPAYTYLWSPATGINDVTSPQPVFAPAQSTVYTVTVTAPGVDTCTVVETVSVTVPPVINLQVAGGGTFCTSTATLTATTDAPATVQWLDNNGQELATGNTFTPAVSGTATYTVVATDALGCSETVEVTLMGGPVNIVVPDTAAVCLGEQIDLSITNLDANDVLTYAWTPTDLFAAGTANSATPDFLEAIGTYTVSVLVTSQFGCTERRDVHVAVLDPNLALGFTSMIDCNGGTVSFTNTSTDAFGYVWDFGDGSPLSYAENPVHTYAIAGMYTVTLGILYDVSCATTFSQDIMVETPQIFARFTYDIEDCGADAATIQFTDASVNTLNNTIGWAWTFANATPATSNEQNPVVTVNNEGPLVVTLTITTANDCDNTTTETLNIDLVDLDIAATDTLTVCIGGSVTLNPDGDASLTYSWTPAATLDDPTAASPVATPTQTTTYFVTAYSTVGADTCFVMDSVVVFVPTTIVLELDQQPTVTTCGEDVVITATANVPVEIVWTSALDGVIGNGPTITVNPFRNDTYTATATDEYGCTTAESVLVIDNGVDINVQGGNDQTACQGVPATLTVVNLDADDTLTYVWSPVENIVGDNTGASVTVLVNEAGTVVFTAMVTNQNACMDTVEVALTLQDFDGQVPDTVRVCYDEPTPLNPDGNTTYTYTWSPTTGLDLTNPANPIATLTQDQTYQVTITDPATGCSNTDEMAVLVYPDLNLESTGAIQLCEITPVQLTAATTETTTFEWFLDGGLVGTGNEITIIPPGDGCFTYTAVATDVATGCQQTSSEVVCVQAFGAILPDGPLTVCANEPIAINPTGDPDLVYTWTPADEAIDLTNPWNPIVTTNVPRTYIVTVMDVAFGCTVTDTIEILVAPQLNLFVTPVDTIICDNSPLTFTANTDFPATAVSWFLLPGNTPIGVGAELVFTPPLGTSQVYAVATSADGCTERDTVTVNNYPINAEITAALVICEPTTAEQLSIINLDPAQVLTVAWNPEGVLTPLDQLTVTVDPNITTAFGATVSNQFGCSQVLNTTVTVIDLLGTLSIAADPTDILLGESSTITVSGCVGCSYTWDPANDDSPVIVVTPTEAGENTYFVTVELLGCTQDLEITLEVQDATCDTDHIFFPNAFTPNGDGDNDVLRIRSNFLDELLDVELLIYNRWGEEMFRTQSAFEGWDGTFRGEQLPPDVYGYYLRVVCPNEDELIQKGNVTLLR